MIQPIYKTLITIIVIILIIIGLFVWRMTSPIFIDKEALYEQGIFLFPEPRELPNLSLKDDSNKLFDNEQLKGKWTFIFFGFTSCAEVCPTSLSELSRLQQNMAQVTGQLPIQYAFFSIDPNRDTPQRIKEYVNAFNKNFIGLTTTKENLPLIANAMNVVIDIPKEHHHDHDSLTEHDHHEIPDQKTEIDHSANIVVINPDGKYHGFIRGDFKADKITPYIPALMKSL